MKMNVDVSEGMTKMKLIVTELLVIIMLGLAFGASVGQAQSGSLEPPSSAVNGSGDPLPTTQTLPSWDQILSASERFKLVMGGDAVLDKQTGLVWEQSPDTTNHVWEENFTAPVDARLHCLRLGTGGQSGWRLPSIHELLSLLVPGNPTGGPDLSPGHPFTNVQSAYWSATTNAAAPTNAWAVNFNSGDLATPAKMRSFSVWCVRGGGPLSEY